MLKAIITTLKKYFTSTLELYARLINISIISISIISISNISISIISIISITYVASAKPSIILVSSFTS